MDDEAKFRMVVELLEKILSRLEAIDDAFDERLKKLF
jgi:hypothetical protein